MVVPSHRTPRQRRRRWHRFPLMAMIAGVGLTVCALRKIMTIGSTSYNIPLPDDQSLPSEIFLHQQGLQNLSVTNPSLLRKQNEPQSIHGWKRLKPSHGGTVYGEIDSFTTGRSCRWQPSGLGGYILSWIFFFSRASFSGQWVCRDCGLRLPSSLSAFSVHSSSWNNCPILPRRRKCPAFDYQGWEDPKPRSASFYDHTSSVPEPIRLITSYGVGKVRKVEYEQPQCRLSRPCFDLDRCIVRVNQTRTILKIPLPVFAYPGQARRDMQQLQGQQNDQVRLVEDPNMACLLIAHVDNLEAAKSTSSWNFGRNHYVYGITTPIDEGKYYDMASLGSVVMTEAHMRIGYDIPLPLPALWTPPHDSTVPNKWKRQQQDLHRPRRWLLSFKGSIQDTLQPYYQHRWLAAEYLFQDPDVAIDVQCKHKTLFGDRVTFAPYDHPSQDHFDDLMINSTFAFCPGGSHVSSFRLTEVLSTGSIPVLLPEIVTPFSPELDWSGCVVRVSQARIVDLPRILRAISPEEVRARRLECQRLYRIFQQPQHKNENPKNAQQQQQTNNAGNGFLATALKIWLLRLEKLHNEHELQTRVFGT